MSSRNETASFGFLHKTSWKNTATSSSSHKCAQASAGTIQIFSKLCFGMANFTYSAVANGIFNSSIVKQVKETAQMQYQF